MVVAENIVTAYRSRPKENWGAWAEKNPALAQILKEAEILAGE